MFKNIIKKLIQNLRDKQSFVMITNKKYLNDVFVVDQSLIAAN